MSIALRMRRYLLALAILPLLFIGAERPDAEAADSSQCSQLNARLKLCQEHKQQGSAPRAPLRYNFGSADCVDGGGGCNEV
jgi:hypothetical protein